MSVTQPRWKGSARLGILAATTLLVGALLTAGTLAEAQGGTGTASAVDARRAWSARLATTPQSARPTVVLVHGAFADASGWAAEINRLRRLGFPVIAPANPLRGLSSDSDYIRSVLATISGPIVLVGHSYGGAVITNAARGVPNVEALVYVGAFVPDQGESIATSYDATKYPGSLLGPTTTEVRPVPNAAAKGGQDIDIYIQAAHFREVFAGDQSTSRALTMAATQRPLALTANLEASGPPAWKSIPSWDLVTLRDKAISPGGQLFMAHRAHAHISTVRSAHDVMVSHPGAVVRTVLAAARQVHSVS
jgi:pimeloyl-ACP methyl ester carboxylesterase